MSNTIKALLLVVWLMLLAACLPNYKTELIEKADAGNTTPITLDNASVIQGKEDVVTFVITDGGISVDSVVNIGNLYRGAEADVIYMVRNESSVTISPMIYFAKDTRIEKYSAVEGKGYMDAPSIVEKWITVSPFGVEIPPKSAQAYIVALTIPADATEVPEKFAFQVGVAIGDKVQLAVCPWWLVGMRN